MCILVCPALKVTQLIWCTLKVFRLRDIIRYFYNISSLYSLNCQSEWSLSRAPSPTQHAQSWQKNWQQESYWWQTPQKLDAYRRPNIYGVTGLKDMNHHVRPPELRYDR